MHETKTVLARVGPDCAECGRECLKPVPIGSSSLCSFCATPYGSRTCVMCDGKGHTSEYGKEVICLACHGDGYVTKSHSKKLLHWIEKNAPGPKTLTEKVAECLALVAQSKEVKSDASGSTVPEKPADSAGSAKPALSCQQ